ncbi:MAG TPA: acetyl-CoA carboxylase biotin carboxyl carrier protein [Polyangia bacterium]
MRAKGKKPSAPSTTTRAANPITERVDALAEVLRRHDLSELEVEEGGVRIYVRRGGGGEIAPAVQYATHAPAPAAHPVHASAATSGAPAASAPASSTDTSDGNVAYVTSPFVGTFYRSPSPDMSPFVDVGTRIKKGQVLCIVEAMKLMNEIESEIEGSIVQILVENGQAVEYGEPLFKIKVG